MHVQTMGHMELAKNNGNLSQIESKLIEIPPFSLVLFREDLPQDGPRADDDISMREKLEFAPRSHF